MATITELIRKGKQTAIRRAYIKRKLFVDGSYETEWQRVDRINGKSLVINWGSVSINIDDEDGRISSFNLSPLTIKFDNSEGKFNAESDPRSLWADFLNRKYTKVKIDCGYLDVDGVTEVGVATVFEGVIDYVKTGDNQIADVRVLPYISVLKGYDISDLSLTGTQSINTIVNTIMNQDKITEFIPYVPADAKVNSNFTDTSTLTGTYWDVIKGLALKSGSVPLLNGDIWSFTDRTESVSSAFDFRGKGEQGTSDILSIKKFDDGDTRVVLNWIVSGTNIQAISTDQTLLRKYLLEPEVIDLSDIETNAEKQNIVDELLSQWESPKKTLEFDTRFFINQLKPLDKITVSIKGQTVPANAFVWGAFTWGDGSVWGKKIGAILIDSNDSFMITSIRKNIDSWTNTIKCEQVV